MRVSLEVTPLVVGLVGCGKSKASVDIPVPARDLYRSSLFSLSMRYADRYADDTHILSGKHGLLAPHELVAPYDGELSQASSEDWAKSVIDNLLAHYHDTTLDLVVLSGRRYSDCLFGEIQRRGIAWSYGNPLLSMGLFQRLRWLKERIDAISE